MQIQDQVFLGFSLVPCTKDALVGCLLGIAFIAGLCVSLGCLLGIVPMLSPFMDSLSPYIDWSLAGAFE
jgi:hypothetical protein